MDDVHIRERRGSLHFIRFPTSEMKNFLSLAKSKGMAQLVTTVCATGGGAFKFEQNFKKVTFADRRPAEVKTDLILAIAGSEHESGQIR